MNENKSGDISDLDNLQNENLEKSIDFKKIKKEIEETLTEDQLKEEKRYVLLYIYYIFLKMNYFLFLFFQYKELKVFS